MAMLCLTDAHVIELVRQLPAAAKKRVLDYLMGERETWASAERPDEQEMRQFAGARGLNWDGLSEAARDQIIDDLWHEA
jgi:hypothetical protein